MDKPPKLKAFITYSHKNTAERNHLEAKIAEMKWADQIETWCDTELISGFKWREQIKEKLEASDVLLYLVSVDSLASPNCNKELSAVMYKNRNIAIIPIILDDYTFLDHRLGEYEALPKINGSILPILRWKSEREAWQNVVEGIQKTMRHIGMKLLRGGLRTRSLSYSLPKIQERPNVMSLVKVGDFSLMLGNYDAAISIYTESLDSTLTTEAYVNNAAVYIKRGIAYENKGDHGRAILDFNKAIEQSPDYAAAYINRGVAYKNKGNLDEAISDFNKAIEITPDSAEAYANRGNVYKTKGDLDKAIPDYDKAIELNPYNAMAYNNRGIYYKNKGDLDKAISDYDKAIELNPYNAGAYNNRAVAYKDKKEYDKSILDYNKSIALNPNSAEAYSNRGIAKKSLQGHKGSKEDFQSALMLAEQQRDSALVSGIQQQAAALTIDLD